MCIRLDCLRIHCILLRGKVFWECIGRSQACTRIEISTCKCLLYHVRRILVYVEVRTSFGLNIYWLHLVSCLSLRSKATDLGAVVADRNDTAMSWLYSAFVYGIRKREVTQIMFCLVDSLFCNLEG